MHRSRLGVILIDHPFHSHDAALSFWAAATGRTPEPEEEPYTSLGVQGGLNVAVQRIGEGTPTRVHLDFETDDVAAETARLVALGATITEPRDDYNILTDPGGLVFCVVPVQNKTEFEAGATTWD